MASYAKQANDDELEHLSKRIRARAIRRAGELLQAIEPANGVRTDLEPTAAADSRFTRTDAAREAGMSDQRSDQATAADSLISRQSVAREANFPSLFPA